MFGLCIEKGKDIFGIVTSDENVFEYVHLMLQERLGRPLRCVEYKKEKHCTGKIFYSVYGF